MALSDSLQIVLVIARITLRGSLRRRAPILLGIVCAIVLSALLLYVVAFKSPTRTSFEQLQGAALWMAQRTINLLNGFGSLMAAWLAADAIRWELESGTVFSIIARPVRPWEFLLGKYVGVQVLLSLYVLGSVGLIYVLVEYVGDRAYCSPWQLLAYSFVRYAMYSALGMLVASFLLPTIICVCAVLGISALSEMIAEGGAIIATVPPVITVPLAFVLPKTALLSVRPLISVDVTPLATRSVFDHVLRVAYGVDYTCLVLLVAMWVFTSAFGRQRTS